MTNKCKKENKLFHKLLDNNFRYRTSEYGSIVFVFSMTYLYNNF